MTLASWAKQLISGLDGLPLTSVPVVELPDDHPDHDTFDTDMAALARMERQLWIAARNQDGDPKPAVPDDDLLCDFIPGADAELFLTVDMEAFELIGDDITAWAYETATTTERLVAEVYNAKVA